MQREAAASLLNRTTVSWPGFLLDLVRRELLDASGRPTELRAQALEVLLVLGENAGQVVGRDELMRRVWGDVVVTDDSLVQAIGAIRRTLGDDKHERVRTVPRRGYLLVTAEAGAATLAVADETTPNAARPRKQIWAIAGATVLVLALAIAALLLAPRAPQPATRSLAILPFAASPESGIEPWFADALTGDLTTKASRWPNVLVIGRGTMQAYGGKPVDARAVARELGVAYILTGHLRREGERIRIDVTLIDGASGTAAWAEQLDVDRADVPASLGDIAGGIAKALSAEWGNAIGERSMRLGPGQVAAEDLAMQGFGVLLKSLGPENFERARQLFEQALVIDPQSIRGLAGASLTNSMGVIFNWASDRPEAARRAEETLARLEAIDPNAHLALLARASLTNMHSDWPGLYAVSTTLLAHFPNDPTSHHHRCSSLLRLGGFADAIPACERALKISPRDSRAPIWNGLIGMNEYMLGHYEAAAARARVMVTGNQRVPFYFLLLAAALAESGQRDEAQRIVTEFRQRHPDFDSYTIAKNWPATDPRFIAGRERIAARARELGLP